MHRGKAGSTYRGDARSRRHPVRARRGLRQQAERHGFVRAERGLSNLRQQDLEAILDSTDLSPWLYNYTPGSQEPYDLGYWVGYRIAKAYYLQARDKREAVRALVQQDDPKAILAASGWTPGMWMPAKVTGVAARSASR